MIIKINGLREYIVCCRHNNFNYANSTRIEKSDVNA